MPVLDANVLIRHARSDEVALAAMARLRGQDLVVPMQAALEYLTGVEDPVAELANLRAAARVEHSTDLVLLEAAGLAARTRRIRQGDKARWNDVLIAAHAKAAGTYVVTTNKRHFTQLGVPAWNYETEQAPPTG